jgi:hypothetical protein
VRSEESGAGSEFKVQSSKCTWVRRTSTTHSGPVKGEPESKFDGPEPGGRNDVAQDAAEGRILGQQGKRQSNPASAGWHGPQSF